VFGEGFGPTTSPVDDDGDGDGGEYRHAGGEHGGFGGSLRRDGGRGCDHSANDDEADGDEEDWDDEDGGGGTRDFHAVRGGDGRTGGDDNDCDGAGYDDCSLGLYLHSDQQMPPAPLVYGDPCSSYQ
jgi:hypothetical protein